MVLSQDTSRLFGSSYHMSKYSQFYSRINVPSTVIQKQDLRRRKAHSFERHQESLGGGFQKSNLVRQIRVIEPVYYTHCADLIPMHSTGVAQCAHLIGIRYFI